MTVAGILKLSAPVMVKLIVIREERGMRGERDADFYHLVVGMIEREYQRVERMAKRRARRERHAAERALWQEADRPLPKRLVNVLLDHEVKSFRQLAEQWTEDDLRAWPRVGDATVREIRKILTEHGLKLRSSRSAWR